MNGLNSCFPSVFYPKLWRGEQGQLCLGGATMAGEDGPRKMNIGTYKCFFPSLGEMFGFGSFGKTIIFNFLRVDKNLEILNWCNQPPAPYIF